MANMTYCRFRNTVEDMQDCIDNIEGTVSDEEHKARKRLVRQSARLLVSLGVSIDDAELKSALDEVDSY